MSDTSIPTELLEKIAALEKRVAHLEARLAVDLPEIPWHVLAAAVAAVIPDGRLVSATATFDRVSFAPSNLWGIGGRLEQFESHRVR